MIITGDYVDEICDLKLKLAKKFEMKYLYTLCYFLGIEVAYSPINYLISRSKYISNIIEQTHIFYTRPTYCSLKLNMKYSPSNSVPLPDPTLYCCLD